MSQPDADTLARLAPLRRQLRDIKGLTESRAGVFGCGGTPLVDFVVRDAHVVAEVRGTAVGQQLLRFDVEQATEARKLLDEVRRRVARLDED